MGFGLLGSSLGDFRLVSFRVLRLRLGFEGFRVSGLAFWV